MWGDTLLEIQRVHVLRLLAWGALSIVAGTTILIVTMLRRTRPDLLRAFSIQCVIWGGAILAAAGWRYGALVIPDIAAAARLERMAWLQIGLFAGIMLTGAGIAITGWRVGRSLRATGTGVGMLLQGAALLVFDLLLVAQVTR